MGVVNCSLVIEHLCSNTSCELGVPRISRKLTDIVAMSGRVKRTPLFGADGLLGIQGLGNNNKKNNNDIMQILKMENPQNPGLYRTHNTSKPNHSDCGKKTSPATPSKAVNFSTNPENEKHREKYLTAKYGAHQMALIRKRLKVEMWMYERLTEIYGADDIEIDLDEVLDMEDEAERRTYISELLRVGCKRPLKVEHVNHFVGDLLE